MGTRLPGFVRPESMGNVGAGSKLPEFVPIQTVGYFGVGAKLPGFGSTFRLSSSSPGIVKERSPVYSQIQKMLRTCTSETETLTPHASLPLDAETMLQEEQKQEEVHVDEVLVLDIGSKREESNEECLVHRDVSRSSDRPLEIEEFEKYLTGDNENEQKNNNDGEDDISNVEGKNSDTEGVENSNSVQKSGAEDDIVNEEVDIENAAIRNSDEDQVENSNSVQKSGDKHDIWKAEVDVRNTEGRNSGNPERVENSNSESDEEDANPTTKEENPTTEEENIEVEETENEDSEAIYSSEEEGMAIDEVENLDDEDLEEDSQSDSSSSEEEDLAGNNSGNPEDISKPEQPENHEQLNIAEFEKSGEQEDIVAEKINEPGGRFVNYFSASHRIPKALDVMRAKGNVIPLSEICRMYLGINRDTVAVYMSSCKMKCCYKVFRSRKFQNLVVRSTSSLNVHTLDKKLQDITTSVLSGNTQNSAGKSSDTEGENYLPLPSYFLSRAKEQANIKCEIITLDQIVLIFFSFKLKKPESLKAMVPSMKERTVVPVSKRKVNITPETKVSGKESGDTRRERNETGSNTKIN